MAKIIRIKTVKLLIRIPEFSTKNLYFLRSLYNMKSDVLKIQNFINHINHYYIQFTYSSETSLKNCLIEFYCKTK